jgi:Na+/H+ antiporter NhaD/arsenite permease-like protein
MLRIFMLALGALAGWAPECAAAEAHGGFDGAALGLVWVVPFAGMLLSIAFLPLLAPHLWEHHFGKVSAFWAAAILIPFAAELGGYVTLVQVAHTVLREYLPFMILLFALFVVAVGIRVVGNLVGTPGTNTAMLGFGTLAASLLGTTGAAMLLIRPMIRANMDRRYNAHVFVFFIFLVCNIGGSLTPLGDPPLFLGFLRGVDFLWTLEHMFAPMVLAGGILLAVFYLLDSVLWRRDGGVQLSDVPRQVRIEGVQNLLYLAGVVGAVFVSGIWDPQISITVLEAEMPLQGLARDAALLGLGYLSWKTTRPRVRIENAFAWAPIQEVAILFAGIFITIMPALAILRAGEAGAMAGLFHLVSGPDGQPNDAAYFWLVGILSSFLDNAPTYLVFFNLAGGDADQLMGPLAGTLLAISAGAVFMGANTYIGNAPNFMVKSICTERGIRMPSFLGYMLWSSVFLLPLFGLVTWVFFL